jgi:hypothetical protein
MKLHVSTHSGEDTIVEVENYNANELNEKLNDNSINTVAIGNVIFSRIDVKLVKPREQNN